jgi:hypothetical protein
MEGPRTFSGLGFFERNNVKKETKEDVGATAAAFCAAGGEERLWNVGTVWLVALHHTNTDKTHLISLLLA